MARPMHCLTAISVALLAQGCSVLQSMAKPEVKRVVPKINGISMDGLDMQFDLDVSNPYPIPLSSDGLRYRLAVGGTELLNSKTTDPINVPAGQTSNVSLPVRISYEKLMSVAKGLRGASEAPYELGASADFVVLGQPLSLPIKHQGKLPILRPPTFADPKVNISRQGLTQVKLAVDANMHNPNAFDLGLEELGYDVKIGELSLGNIQATTDGKVGAGKTSRIRLSGEVSGASALRQLLGGKSLGKAHISPTGTLVTPYGPVRLPK